MRMNIKFKLNMGVLSVALTGIISLFFMFQEIKNASLDQNVFESLEMIIYVGVMANLVVALLIGHIISRHFINPLNE